jgi:hypothetical protein
MEGQASRLPVLVTVKPQLRPRPYIFLFCDYLFSVLHFSVFLFNIFLFYIFLFFGSSVLRFYKV